MAFKIFTRTWWRNNKDWPDGLEPHAGRRRTLTTVQTEEEARDLCQAWNASHAPGRLSRKAEYDRT